MSVTVSNPTSNLSGKELMITTGTHTVTGLLTFDRDPSAPFAVTSGSAKVSNLDADLLDGLEAAAFAALADNETVSGSWTFSELITSAKGVVFPATQVSSAGANTLDDYEEGTWTPADGSGAALSFTSVQGFYVKIGQLVVAGCDFTYPATADGSTALISGLPFTSQTTTNAFWGGIVAHTSEATLEQVSVNTNATTFNLRTAAGAAITNATLTTDVVRVTLVYRAAA